MRIGFAYVALLAVGCTGSRHVVRPGSPTGYMHLELRDIAALGPKDQNVEIDAQIGTIGSDDICNGLVTISLAAGTLASSPANFDMAATMSAMTNATAVTLTLPRSRYSEVRDLKTLQRVRVRGYISDWFADGCDWFDRDSHRHLWIDTIEPLPDAPEH